MRTGEPSQFDLTYQLFYIQRRTQRTPNGDTAAGVFSERVGIIPEGVDSVKQQGIRNLLAKFRTLALQRESNVGTIRTSCSKKIRIS
jgi:hypothetical protein